MTEKIMTEKIRSGVVSAETLSAAVSALRSGHCVGMPTETVYGLAADALNPLGVARVFETKRRPAFDPLIMHVSPTMNLESWVHLNDTARHLMERFWPGPLTLLVEKTPEVSEIVTSGHPTVALRCPAHPVARQLLDAFGGPLVAPSANLFGQLSPTSASAVREGLGDRLEVILDGGECTVGLESTIVDTTAPPPQLPILRLGGIPPRALSDLGYQLSYPTPIIGRAPGTLKNHYAPRLPLYLFEPRSSTQSQHDRDRARMEIEAQRFAHLGWRATRTEFGVSTPLSPSGDSVEGAARLFSTLREYGAGDWDGIIAELPPPDELGGAIRDRLTRGASGYAEYDESSQVWSIPSTQIEGTR